MTTNVEPDEEDFIEPTQDDADQDQCDRIARMAASIAGVQEFKPAEWVANAMRSALDAGREQGRDEGRKSAELEHRMLADAIQETFTTRESHLVHQAIAAVLESLKAPCVDIDIDAMRTISDRVKLKYESADGLATVRITLEKL
jgi:flagellar biosynthesis/type III secretory pathway protein FliH